MCEPPEESVVRRSARLWWFAVVICCCFFVVSCADDSNDDDDQTAADTEPSREELGLRLAPVSLDFTGLSQAEIDQVILGSYLVNGAVACFGCHSSEAGYLAGGVAFPLFPDVDGETTVVTRNLTPDPDTGLQLSEAAFIEAMRTGKDFADSTDSAPQRLIVHPWHVYRFMSLQDLRAIYAYLQRIPPVRHTVRKRFIPPFPFPPVPVPAIGDGDPNADPDNVERGLRIPQFFSSGPDADAFVAAFDAAVANLTAEERALVGRGSYVVNALGDCNGCHTDGSGAGDFDSGLIPLTVDVNTAAYLAGGVDIGPVLGLPFPIFSRNLTPEATTGLSLTVEEFVQVMRFGADFRRPGGSLRVVPHFPSEFRFALDDLQAIYAYLQHIPAITKAVDINP